MGESVTKERFIKDISKILSDRTFRSSKCVEDFAEDLWYVKDYLTGYLIGTPQVMCKDCKYYHEDFWGEVPGAPVPIIIAHQICTKWGGGCRTIENGFCHFGELRGKE